MAELASLIGTGILFFLCATLMLLFLGINFLPDWTKSPGLLLVASVLVVLGSGSMI